MARMDEIYEEIKMKEKQFFFRHAKERQEREENRRCKKPI
jgi:hypothetical protein